MTFKFTKEQHDTLGRSWKRPGDQAGVRAYLDAIEPRVGMWLAMYAQGPTHREIRDTCRDFADRLADVLRYMDAEHESLFALVHGQDDFTEGEVRAAAAALRAGADTLIQAARGAARAVTVETGPDNAPERLLVAQLAALYRRAFGKEPSPSPGTNFRLFLRELGDAIGKQFGDETIKSGIADRGVFVPPAVGWHIGKSETL